MCKIKKILQRNNNAFHIYQISKKNIFGKFKYIYSTIEWNYCVSGANVLIVRLPEGSEDYGEMVETSPSTSICTPGI